jgi:hypothetical protein
MHLTLCDYLTDIVQNAVEAGSSRVSVEVCEGEGAVRVDVSDNGKGMDPAALKRAFDPFHSEAGKHPGRRVGLGLPFLRQAVEQTRGALDVMSEPGAGTTVRFRFPADHADTPPAGDWPGTLTALMALSGGCELVVKRERDGRGYTVERGELIEALGGLETAETLSLARLYFEGQEQDLNDRAQP